MRNLAKMNLKRSRICCNWCSLDRFAAKLSCSYHVITGRGIKIRFMDDIPITRQVVRCNITASFRALCSCSKSWKIIQVRFAIFHIGTTRNSNTSASGFTEAVKTARSKVMKYRAKRIRTPKCAEIRIPRLLTNVFRFVFSSL